MMDYIFLYINGICLNKIILQDMDNNIVYNKTTSNNIVKIPIINNKSYNIFILNKGIIIPIIAIKNKTYYININNYNSNKRLITFFLKDKFSNTNIKRGEIILWQDKQSQ